MSTYDIAIIGVTGRFPGADTVEAFWENLANGVESIQQFTDEQLATAGVPQELIEHPDYVKAGAIIDDVDHFDAGLFGFTPHEAAIANPQQRLFLECAWETLERAGHDPEQFPGRIGVYAGAATNHYLTNLDDASSRDEIAGLQAMVGNEPDYLATQVAYKLNLTGPALTVQTACSTSLVAVHQACQSLLNHECDMVLAGGSTILLPNLEGYLYVEGSINSPDGHCRAFDAQAQGTVPASGVGVVLLRRLEDAVEAGDTILAVIKGTAVNNDGALKIGYTAPSLEGQANVIADAQAMADIDPATISYIETHGTGTTLGDPIEIGALTQAFRAQTAELHFCRLGALKTNIGHLGAAAGVAGLIKTVLALQNQCMPPTLHFTQPNDKINFDDSPFIVNDRATPWPRSENGAALPRRAGVSSFGIGGTNAHVIVEEAPTAAPSTPARPWELLLLSAQTPAALEQMTHNLNDHLKAQPDTHLGDMAYTLQVGRKRLDHGRVWVCQNIDDATDALARPTAESSISVNRTQATRSVIFMFSGQGSQHVEMGHELYQHEPCFRAAVDQCAEILTPHLGLDIKTLLYPNTADRAQATDLLNQTKFTQPALFVIEYALAQLWMSWGIVPQAMIGHSIGEYVAACLAGVFSLEDALYLVAARGRLMQEQPTGEMLAIELSPEALRPNLNGRLALAAINSPEQSVVAGPAEAISAFERRFNEQDIRTRRLSTSHAFHSAMMEPMLEPFSAIVSQISLNPPEMPYLSNVSGTWITAAEATDPTYWAKHVRQPVNFAAGIEKLAENPEWILLEVGPGTALTNLATHHPARTPAQTVLASLPHVKDTRSAMQVLLQTLGQLYLHGVDVNWTDYYQHEKRQRILLPTYPFQKERYWIDSPATSVKQADNGKPDDSIQKLPMAEWLSIPVWQQSQPPSLLPQLEANTSEQPYLILLDEEGVGHRLADSLRQQGQTVITVAIDETFAQPAADHFTLNPTAYETYQKLWAALYENGQPPHTIIHLWSVSGNGVTRPISQRLSELENTYQRSFDSLLSLAQVIGEQGDDATQQIIVVANQLHAVLDDESITPEKSLLLGCCRVIEQEYPNLSCRSVDVVLPQVDAQQAMASTQQLERVIDQLQAEVRCLSDEMVVAYRGRRRWTQTYTPIMPPEATSQNADAVALRKHGVYLITAGLSATALHIADDLAQRTQAKLVLIDSEDVVHQENAQDQIAALQAHGAEVLLLHADVTDLAQMQGAIQAALAQLGTIHGVIHIPTATHDSLIQITSIADTRAVLNSRVRATLVLEVLLQDTELDFMALFGSTVAISGGIGQVDECAANLFLGAYASSAYASSAYASSAYAHSRHQPMDPNQRFVTAVDWALWQWDDRYEQSMAEFLQVQEEFRTYRETFGITQDEAGDVLQYALRSQQPELVVSPQGLESLLEQQRTLTMENVTAQLESGPNSVTSVNEQTHTGVDAPIGELETVIGQAWQDVFGIPQVGRHDNFFALGGHSLLSIQLITRLRNALALPELALSILYEQPTVAMLADMIQDEQQSAEQSAELDLEELASGDDADFAALLAEIEELSETELLEALEIGE